MRNKRKGVQEEKEHEKKRKMEEKGEKKEKDNDDGEEEGLPGSIRGWVMGLEVKTSSRRKLVSDRENMSQCFLRIPTSITPAGQKNTASEGQIVLQVDGRKGGEEKRSNQHFSPPPFPSTALEDKNTKYNVKTVLKTYVIPKENPGRRIEKLNPSFACHSKSKRDESSYVVFPAPWNTRLREGQV